MLQVLHSVLIAINLPGQSIEDVNELSTRARIKGHV